MGHVVGIPTKYGGIQFRSRLEAKWASFFDTLGWEYEYEPFDLAGWIPDFALMLRNKVLVEVKPSLDVEELSRHSDKIDRAEPSNEVLLVGATPFMDDHVIGLFWDGMEWSEAESFRCVTGHGLGWCHSTGSFMCRVCGEYDGDHHKHPISDAYMSTLREQWAIASNISQWRGRP